MLVVGLWEIAAPVGAGHFAVVGSRGIIADNFLTWKIIAPVRSYLFSPPQGASVYAHHPWGTFWIIGVCRWLFGRHDWIPRVYPVVMNVLMPGLLYAFGRSLWGRLPGALCALGWSVLPITLAFAQFPGFEVPVVFGCLWVGWAVVRFRQTGLLRWGFLAILGFIFAAHSDWTASLFVLLVCGLAVLGLAFAPERCLVSFPVRRALRFWVFGVLAITASLLFYLRAFDKLGQTSDWLHSAEFRAAGHEQPLKAVLLARRYWIETMFTKIGIAVSIIGAVVMLLRLIFIRRFEEWLPLLLLLVSTFHYVYFKNGADIHIYWPLPFAAQFALSLGAIGASLSDAIDGTLPEPEDRGSNFGAHLALLGLLGLAALLILPDGLRGLNYARNTGGRFNEHGRFILQDFDKTVALRFFAAKLPAQTRVALDTSFNPNWSQEYALQRPTSEINLQYTGRAGDRFRLLDSRFASAEILTQVASQSPITVVGNYWLIDGEKDPAPLTAYRFVDRKPTFLERLFRQAHDPMQRIEPDPFETWELRLHFAQNPNPQPDQRPQGLQQMRVVHNLAVALGDKETARQYREQLEHSFDRSLDEAFPNGARLIGQRLVEGILSHLELYFLAAGPLAPNTTYDVWSNVKKPARFSFVMADDTTKSQSMRFSLPPSLWKAGMIYTCISEIRKRPGLEQFEGAWATVHGPNASRAPAVPVRRLLELP
jgi:hypothetical protein